MSEWIKCSDRMPGIGSQVLCINKSNAYEVAIYDVGFASGNAFFGTTSGKFHPTHWMPLPEPPKE